MKKIKRRIFLFFRKHYKIYTLAILAIGIALGCTYDGKNLEGTHFFKVREKVFYIGVTK